MTESWLAAQGGAVIGHPALEAGPTDQPAREAGRKPRRWLAYCLPILALPVLVALALTFMLSSTAKPARADAVYTGLGFDTCSTPSASTMQAWLSSPYRGIGVYVGGANAACLGGNLSAGWASTVQAQGWKLAPLYVGLQAPCVNQGGLATIDPGAASGQGAAAADDAAQRSANLGLGAGTPIYFDMEAYGSGCSGTVIAFLDAWTAELHRLGLVAGVYGSSASAIHDLAASNPNVPDDVWWAAWNGSTSVFGDPNFPDSAWANHQRIHQYQGDTSQSFGGVSLDIDLDSFDGSVAGGNPNCTTFSSPSTGSHQVCGVILEHYLALGGPSGFLGFPTTDELPTPNGLGRFNYFSNHAAIYWTPAGGAWSIDGAILDKWGALGFENSVLGFPITDELGTPNGQGRFNIFTGHGAIYWTPAAGAWSIHGAIFDRWGALGFENSVLGFPVTDELGTPNGQGRFNIFTGHGGIYWTPAHGAWSIHGAIFDRWGALGFENSVLGFPITDELGTPNKLGRFNIFTGHGGIYWTPAHGAWSIHGAIFDRWASLGFENSFLGFPVTDELITPNKVAHFNIFTGHGGIYWTPAAGAWSIHGAIFDRWASLGFENSVLGVPVTDETGTPDGVGRFNHFSSTHSLADVNGSIYWTPATNAHEVHGAIRVKWARMGWERSCLGYPTSDEKAIPGGRESTFQHGHITYSFSTQIATSSC